MSTGPTRPELVGDFGMVASTHWIASSAAMSMLERGGNAADAAAAAGFVLQVIEPHLNGPGGEAPIIVWDEREQRTETICGQGVTPASASVELFRGMGLDHVPGTGLLAAVVPGAFGAWLTLLERYGTMSLREVLEPCVHYARTGHPLLSNAATAIASVRSLFTEHWATSADLWLPGGKLPKAGERFVNPALAATYERVLVEAEAGGTSRERVIAAARDLWYRGFVADEIERFSQSTWAFDTSGERHNGLLTAADLSGWAPRVEAPESVLFADRYEVFKGGFWSQGPVLLQQLLLLEALGIESTEVGSEAWIHLLVEAGKLAFADREAWYGDPLFTAVDQRRLLQTEYATARAMLVTDEASMELRPGSIDGLPPLTMRRKAETGVSHSGAIGEPTMKSAGTVRGDTCHVDVVDRWGMMISATPSGGWLQSSPAIAELGFCLSNRAQMFLLEPGHPNSLHPGARPRTTLSPSFAMRDGKAWMAFGTPGGDSQDQWQLQFLLRMIAGSSIQEAIDAPGFHSEHVPNSFYPHSSSPGEVVIESRAGEKVLSGLRRRGHRVQVADAWSEGRLSAVASDAGWLRAGANARGNQGYAVGR
ncbi:MAG TPA: gamma-glutamyltransferase [Propionibacteriaceae bacterium]